MDIFNPVMLGLFHSLVGSGLGILPFHLLVESTTERHRCASGRDLQKPRQNRSPGRAARWAKCRGEKRKSKERHRSGGRDMGRDGDTGASRVLMEEAETKKGTGFGVAAAEEE